MRSLSIYAGSTNQYVGGTEHNVVEAYPHPYYNYKTKAYDIVVFKVDPPFVLNGRTMKAIDLAEHDDDLAAGTKVFVTGWGTVEHSGGILPVNLRGVEVTVVDRQRCREMYGKKRIMDAHICAADTLKDSCTGDSGGPMVVNGTLMGIVSTGIQCARPKYPGLYTRIGQTKVWHFIQKVINM